MTIMTTAILTMTHKEVSDSICYTPWQVRDRLLATVLNDVIHLLKEDDHHIQSTTANSKMWS